MENEIQAWVIQALGGFEGRKLSYHYGKAGCFLYIHLAGTHFAALASLFVGFLGASGSERAQKVELEKSTGNK